MSVSPPRGLGKAVLAFIGLRLLLVPLFYVVNRVIVRAVNGNFRTVQQMMAVEGVARAGLTAVVALLFMIWVRGELVALQNAGIQTRTSPLMAILGWFIPFGNLVLPVLGAREVYKLRLPGASSALPVVWWVSYLASMVTNNVVLPFPIAMVMTLVSFGAWFAMVYNVVSAPASFGAGPMPMPYGQTHPQAYGPPPAYYPPRI